MIQTPVDATKDRLFQEFNAVVTETEQLLKTIAGAGSERLGTVKANVEQGLAGAAERLEKIRREALSQASAAAQATDEYVHGNPWRSVGIVAALAAVTGLVAGLLISRR